MKTFKDLVFGPKPFGSGEQAKLFFENGYGVSVITGDLSFTDKDHPYELAVLAGNEEKSALCYDTPVTGDVKGYQTADDITGLMKRVQELPKE